MHKSLNNSYGIANLEQNLGLLNMKMGNYDLSEKYMLSAEKYFINTFSRKDAPSGQQGLIYSELSLARLYFKKVDIERMYEKVKTAFETLPYCIGHPNFYEIIATFLYCFFKMNSIAQLNKFVDELKTSSLYNAILEHNYETVATGETEAKEFVLKMLNPPSEFDQMELLNNFEINYSRVFTA